MRPLQVKGVEQPQEAQMILEKTQKREYDGKYAFDGNLERLCVCGHTLGFHGCGSPADCLFDAMDADDKADQPGADKPECGCQKFRLSRKKRESV